MSVANPSYTQNVLSYLVGQSSSPTPLRGIVGRETGYFIIDVECEDSVARASFTLRVDTGSGLDVTSADSIWLLTVIGTPVLVVFLIIYMVWQRRRSRFHIVSRMVTIVPGHLMSAALDVV